MGDRRQFVREGAGMLVATGLTASLASASTSASAAAGSTPKTAAALASEFAMPEAEPADSSAARLLVDDTWLERLAGRRALFFDAPKHINGGALITVMNYLNAMTGAHAFAPDTVVPILGLHGTAIGLAMQDTLWAKYKLGERFEADDPLTKTRSVRNPWYAEADSTTPLGRNRVKALQDRGLIVLVCGNNLRGWAGVIARDTQQTADAVRSEIESNLIPGAIVVPAMVAASQRAQQAGASYAYVGG